MLDYVIVSTNNDQFIAAQDEDLKKYFLRRPDEICGPEARGYTYVKHAIEHIQTVHRVHCTHFVSLPPTGPLRRPDDIDLAVELLLSDPEIDSVTSMTKVNQMYHGLKQKVVDPNGLLRAYLEDEKNNSTYQQLPEVLVRNCSIYASKVDVLENKSMIGPKCKPYMMPQEYSIDINEMIDFEFAEFLYKKHNKL